MFKKSNSRRTASFIFISLAAFLFITGNVFGKEIHSTKEGGNWDDTKTWVNGEIPGKGDNAFIEGKVVAKKDTCCDSIWVELDCRLEILVGVTVTCRSITFNKENGREGSIMNSGIFVVDLTFNMKEEDK